MTPVNGIGSNGKVHFKGPLGTASPIQLARTLGLRATPAARERLVSYLQSGKNPAHLLTLFGRTCSALHLESGKFTEEIFAERFSQWQVEGLERDPDPDSPSYHTRFLLRKFTNCDLAYHEGSGLAIVSSEERDDIAKGDAEGYQLACPFAAKPQIISPPISAPLPRITLTRRVMALVKHLAQPLAEKRSYSEQLRQRILFHVTEGHFRSAAFLLFRDKTAREILAFVRKENLAERITSSEWTALLRIGMRLDIDYSAPSEEIAIGYLLAETHPVISAYFIEDLAKSDPHSASRILGLVGQTIRSVEVAEVGDLISDVERSLAGYVLSSMLIRGQEKLANRVVSSGLLDGVFRETYVRVLNELHSDFDESVVTIGQYNGSSLFEKGVAAFRQVEGKTGTAMVKVKPGAYGWGGEELLSPRLFYRNLARKLIEGEGYDLAWEMMTCGRPAGEAFNDLNSVLDPASFGRLLRTRSRDEIARFVVEVFTGGEEHIIEALAYVLRDPYEDLRDVAGLFEYLIETDGEIPGSREAAYAILYYAATAIENPSMAPLLDRYQETLVQIEQDKENAGWFNADVFLKEGRFLPTDPLSEIRVERVKFYFDLLIDKTLSAKNRIYAVKMLSRMGATEGLEHISSLLKKGLDSDDPVTPWVINLYLDLMEALDPKTPAFRKHCRLLLSLRDRLSFILSSHPEEALRLIAEAGQLEIGLPEKAEAGRKAEIKGILSRCLIILDGIPADSMFPQYVYEYESLVQMALVVLTIKMSKTEATGMLKDIFPKIWKFLGRMDNSNKHFGEIKKLISAMRDFGLSEQEIADILNAAVLDPSIIYNDYLMRAAACRFADIEYFPLAITFGYRIWGRDNKMKYIVEKLSKAALSKEDKEYYINQIFAMRSLVLNKGERNCLLEALGIVAAQAHLNTLAQEIAREIYPGDRNPILIAIAGDLKAQGRPPEEIKIILDSIFIPSYLGYEYEGVRMIISGLSTCCAYYGLFEKAAELADLLKDEDWQIRDKLYIISEMLRQQRPVSEVENILAPIYSIVAARKESLPELISYLLKMRSLGLVFSLIDQIPVKIENIFDLFCVAEELADIKYSEGGIQKIISQTQTLIDTQDCRKNPNGVISYLLGLARCFMQNGYSRSLIEQVLAQALRVRDKNQSKYSDDEHGKITETIYKAYIDAQLFDKPIDLVRNFPESKERDWLLSKVACYLSQAGHFEEALSLTDEIEIEPIARAAAYKDIAINMAKADLAQKAYDVAQKIHSHTIKIDTLIEIAKIISQHGATPETIKTLIIDTFSIARTINDDWNKYSEFKKIIDLLSGIKLPMEILAEILMAFDFHLGELKKRSYRGNIRWLLAPLRARIGFFNAALRYRKNSPGLHEIAREINDFPAPNTPGLTSLEQALAWLHIRIYAILGMAEE